MSTTDRSSLNLLGRQFKSTIQEEINTSGEGEQMLTSSSAESYQAEILADAARLAAAPADPAPGWPKPAGLKPRLLPVPLFDMALFPSTLRASLLDVSRRMSCPPDWPAVSLLVTLGSLIGNRCGIRPKQLDTSWLEVPNLWGAIVAEPSSLKTPALNAALMPLQRLEDAARKEFDQNIRLHEAAAEVLKARKEAIKKKLAKAADKGDESELQRLQIGLAELEAVEAPKARRYIVNDTTVEKLIELQNQNPHGLLVYRDELTGLLMSWEKHGREGDRQFFLEAWTGTSEYRSDRIGRGSLYVPRCCLAVLGGIQPDRLAQYLHQTLHGGNDGMTQRFSLLAWPDPVRYNYVDEVPDLSGQLDVVELLRRLDQFDPVQLGATLLTENAIPSFQFSATAQEVFVSWLIAWQRDLEATDEAPALVQHLAKYRKLYPALALLFHLIQVVGEQAASGPVSSEAAKLAGQWCTYFAAHAQRVYTYGAGVGGGATALGERIKKKQLPNRFTLRDVQRKNWQELSNYSSVRDALEVLVEADWIREAAPMPAAGTGRPRSAAFEINPRLFLPIV